MTQAHTGGFMSSVLGLAWDLTAVTTGPVTCPVLLSLGLAMAPRRRSSDQEERPELAGFGLVAFSSIIPVASILLLAFVLLNTHRVTAVLHFARFEHRWSGLRERGPSSFIVFHDVPAGLRASEEWGRSIGTTPSPNLCFSAL